MAASYSYAETIPYPSWAYKSVINGQIKKFTVQGDQNYIVPSDFVWHVYGGRMFYDEEMMLPAGDGTIDTVQGNTDNVTEMWIMWDVFDTPRDTGYVYLTEISADGCQKLDDDQSKYIGLNMDIVAPPDVRFLTESTSVCSYSSGIGIEIQIEGFAPFDLTYTLNGQTVNWHVEDGDMIDSDGDGEDDNLIIPFDEFIDTESDQTYVFELIEAVSEGVSGDVLEYGTHTVSAYALSEAPVIDTTWAEVTQTETHTIMLEEPGTNPSEWYWELYHATGTLAEAFPATSQDNITISFDYMPGKYYLLAYYLSQNGCISVADTFDITIFPIPTIAFADTCSDVASCSYLDGDEPDEFIFTVEYTGALTYSYIYALYDYQERQLGDPVEVTDLSNRITTITIEHTFINDIEPEQDRIWTLKILSAENKEGVEATVLDGGITGGQDERDIRIHQKPVITDDIDFAN